MYSRAKQMIYNTPKYNTGYRFDTAMKQTQRLWNYI